MGCAESTTQQTPQTNLPNSQDKQVHIQDVKKQLLIELQSTIPETKDQLNDFKNDCVKKIQQQSAGNYTDLEFPHAIKSLSLQTDHIYYDKFFSKVQWLRPNQFLGTDFANIKLFDSIESTDIEEGQIKQNYEMSNFFATISALAEFPDRIKQIFNNKFINQYGYYSLTFFVNGIPTEVVVDDFIPCIDKKPLFTRPKGNEIWCLILEKAWAKLHKCYTNIEKESTETTMSYLTGNHCETFSKSMNDELFLANQNATPDKLITLLKTVDTQQGIICAKTKSKDEFIQNKVSWLLPKFVYTIIGIYDLDKDKVLKVRNPWGRFEYKGKYADNSSVWTEQFKKIVSYENKNDGIFYMTIQEFLNGFDEIIVNHYKKGSFLKYFNKKEEKKKIQSYYYSFDIKAKQTEVNVRVHQPLAVLQDKHYSYSPLELALYKYNQQTNKIDMLAQGDKTRFFGNYEIGLIDEKPFIHLEPGKYIVKFKFEKSIPNFSISVESSSPIAFSEMLRDAGKKLTEEVIFQTCEEKNNPYIEFENIQGCTLKKFKHLDSFYFVVMNETKDSTFQMAITFDQLVNYKIHKKNKTQNKNQLLFHLKPQEKQWGRLTQLEKVPTPCFNTKIDCQLVKSDLPQHK